MELRPVTLPPGRARLSINPAPTGFPVSTITMGIVAVASRAATHDNAFDAALRRLASAIARHFVHAPSGCIAELPIGADDNRLEPGHQFEWFWLVKQAGSLFEASGLDESLTRAFSFAQQYGVDPQTGGVCASLDETGRIKDATQRIWAQTEYLRALASHHDPAALAALPRQTELFRQQLPGIGPQQEAAGNGQEAHEHGRQQTLHQWG